MAITVYFAKVAKRKNSTLQATFNTSFDVVLKSDCSIDRPTFLLSSGSFDFNVAKWGDKYYFIDEIKSVRNGQWEVGCVIDVLATYKADILASTQFVSYSSQSGGTWLADTRIPLLKNANVAVDSTSMNFLFTAGGFFVLTAVGEHGCRTYALDQTMLDNLLANVSTWRTTLKSDVETNIPYPIVANATEALQNLTHILEGTGTFGNAYLDAPNCIRSCIWVPFFASFFTSSSGGNIHLGAFDTGVAGIPCKVTPESRTATLTIPWQHNDWRRSVCEEIYVYLPLVGMVNIPSDEIINESTIDITWSATATDGCIAYLVKAGSQVIGTYGANCSVNVPIGISQQASAGEIVQSIIGAAPKMVAATLIGSPVAGVVAGASVAMDIGNAGLNRHNTCIGGIGGGAGVGLDLSARCISVSHDTVVTPSSMAATLGLPTMKPISLATLTGYCQCANAHVAANGAQGFELDAIDSFLNTGFYIE